MRNVLLIGATGDIGSAIHKNLADMNVISVSKEREPLYPSHHHFIDLTLPVSKEKVLEITESCPTIDALIYVPGIAQFDMIQDINEESIDAQYNIQFKNLVIFIQSILDKLRRSDNGRIIVISSVWGQIGASCESIYASMKGAQNTLVKSLAKELATSNVTVNAIAPGVVKGHMTDLLDEEDKKELLLELPQNKWIEPSEVASLVRYILSAQTKSITGEVFNINGGWYT